MLGSTSSIAQDTKTFYFQIDRRVLSYFGLNNKVPQTEFLPYLNLKYPHSLMCLNSLSQEEVLFGWLSNLWDKGANCKGALGGRS